MDETPMDETTVRSRKSVIWTIVGATIVVALAGLYVWGVMYKPAYSATRTANSAVSCAAGGCTVHLQIQPVVGNTGAGGPNNAWLGYQTDTVPVHPGTILTLPGNTLVTVIVRNFDSQTPLRNPFFSLVQGTVGGVEYVNGKAIHVMDPNVTSHTFTIPDFGVSVPMYGVPTGKPPTVFETMKFTFRTPNRKGVFRWQCIVPCGWGLYGNGGPMGELGYMQGLINLV
jgi:hypothetical protein